MHATHQTWHKLPECPQTLGLAGHFQDITWRVLDHIDLTSAPKLRPEIPTAVRPDMGLAIHTSRRAGMTWHQQNLVADFQRRGLHHRVLLVHLDDPAVPPESLGERLVGRDRLASGVECRGPLMDRDDRGHHEGRKLPTQFREFQVVLVAGIGPASRRDVARQVVRPGVEGVAPTSDDVTGDALGGQRLG